MQPSPPHTESAHGPLKVPLKGPEMLGFSHNGEIVRGVGVSLGCSLVDKLYLPGIDFPTLKCMCSLVSHLLDSLQVSLTLLITDSTGL